MNDPRTPPDWRKVRAYQEAKDWQEFETQLLEEFNVRIHGRAESAVFNREVAMLIRTTAAASRHVGVFGPPSRVVVTVKNRYSGQEEAAFLERQQANQRRVPSFDSLRAAVDWVPSPKTRKLLCKLVADQVALAEELTAKGRQSSARWTWLNTWPMLLWYVFRSSISSIAKAVRGRDAEE